MGIQPADLTKVSEVLSKRLVNILFNKQKEEVKEKRRLSIQKTIESELTLQMKEDLCNTETGSCAKKLKNENGDLTRKLIGHADLITKLNADCKKLKGENTDLKIKINNFEGGLISSLSVSAKIVKNNNVSWFKKLFN